LLAGKVNTSALVAPQFDGGLVFISAAPIAAAQLHELLRCTTPGRSTAGPPRRSFLLRHGTLRI
jgi:hypothetical protein